MKNLLEKPQLSHRRGVSSLVKPLRIMHRKPPNTDDSWEHDAVWKLLDHATSANPSPRFIDDTVRAARLADQPESWWKRLLAPAPIAGMAAACTALALTIIRLSGPTPEPDLLTTAFDSPQAAAIEEIAETETLIAAVDHLDDFSDYELASMIGF